MARVLIAGCGYVGSALAGRLAKAGHAVWGLKRKAGTSPDAGSPGASLPDAGLPEAGLPDVGLPEGVVAIAADLCEPGTLNNLPANLDFVFYTAAADASDEAAYRAAYIDGLGNIFSALKSQNQKLKRFFFTSSTAVYGQDAGEWVDENSPTEPDGSSAGGFRGQIMREAEALARGSDFPAVIVRFGGIYGPGRTRFMKRALRAEAAGNTTSEQALGGEGHLGEISEDAAKAHENLGGVSKGAVKVGENQRNVGEGAAKGSEGAAHERWGNRIHRDDCAGVLHHLMDITQVKSIYCAVDEAPAPQSEVARWLYERHVALKAPGRPAPGRPEPGRPEPARAAAIDRLEGVSGIARQEGDTGDDRDIPPTGSAPAGSARSRGLASSGIRGKRCSNEQIKASGYKFRYPTYQEGYEALLLGEEI